MGGARSALARLQFLAAQGHETSILSFLPEDRDPGRYVEELAACGGEGIRGEGSVCRAAFRGVDYRHEVLPVDPGGLLTRPRPAVGAVQRCLREEGVEFVLTSDEAYWALLASCQLRLPGAHFFHALPGVERFARNPGYVWLLRRRVTVANSRFLADVTRARLGLDAAVWYPRIDLQAYRCRGDGGRRGRIGFYSAGRIKGSAIVAEVAARMPEREFLVAGTYVEPPAANVTRRGYLRDMRELYREIDLLLVPSMWEEAFGRVVLEAAVNGIPSIANRVGGLPEAVGDGGVLIDREPGETVAVTAGRYVAAIRALLDDDAAWAEASRRARARAEAYEREQDRTAREFCARSLRRDGDSRAAVTSRASPGPPSTSSPGSTAGPRRGRPSRR